MLHRYLLLSADYDFVFADHIGHSQTPRSPWKALPRYVWHVRDSDPSVKAFVSAATERLKDTVVRSGFQYMEINAKAIEKFLPKAFKDRAQRVAAEINDRIDLEVFKVAYSLALVLYNGGAFLSHELFPAEGLSWLADPQLIDSALLYFAYTATPKTLLFFRPAASFDYSFAIDEQREVKLLSDFHFAFDFIAGEKDSPFLQAMVEAIFEFAAKSNAELSALFG